METTDKEHLLLVDDEKHLLISLKDYLSYEGFDITVAQSGEEALEKLKTLTPSLIILDISMPGMGGLGFLKMISSHDGKPRYPVLVLTARAMMANFFGNLDIDGFIAKPCEEAELVKRIRSIISKRKAISDKQQRKIKKVTVAEDDEKKAQLIVSALKAAGYDVNTVANGPEALEKAAAEKPDLLLIKEILPRLNGSAVAALVDVMPSLSSTQIVIYDDSRPNDDVSASRFSRLKCVRKFVPSTEVDRLVKAVQEVLS